MSYAVEVNNLCKSYRDFRLQNISFCLPAGSIMGFVGENGAGKTTTIKAMLGLVGHEQGEVRLLAHDAFRAGQEIRRDIGVVFDECMFHDTLRLKEIDRIMSRIFDNWDSSLFAACARNFKLPETKRVKDYSRGMKMKLSIAAALAHHPRLLILDEATSGLDPVVRDELLEMFLDFIQDESRSIFFSTHITSDLDRIADYITFIHQGAIVFSEEKDRLLEEAALVRCGEAAFRRLDPAQVIRWRKNSFGYEALARDYQGLGTEYVCQRPSIEEIILFYVRGEMGGGEEI